jgi:Zn-dependent protease
MNIDPAAIAIRLLVMLFSLSVHECAHALVAFRLGDPTAKNQGRITLDPRAHIDPVGTLLLPLMQAVTGIPGIGWAKPVPVNPSLFRRTMSMRVAHALVAAAGPLSNLLLAIIATVLTAVLHPTGITAEILFTTIVMNCGLFVFNFLPVPGLDGSRLLPRSLDRWQKRVAPYASVILLIIVAVRPISHYVIGVPTAFVAHGLLVLFGAV